MLFAPAFIPRREEIRQGYLCLRAQIGLGSSTVPSVPAISSHDSESIDKSSNS